MNQLTLKSGLSITCCAMLALYFRFTAIMTCQRVLLLKAVAKDCITFGVTQRQVGTAARQLAVLFNKGIKPHRLYIKIVLADLYRELAYGSARSIKIDIECKMKNILLKLSEGRFMRGISVIGCDHILRHSILPLTYHASSHMAKIARNINLNLKHKTYFTIHTENRVVCVHKQRHVHKKKAGKISCSN